MAFLAGQDLTAAALNLFGIGPIAHLRQTTVQSIPSATFTTINFDSEDIDTDSGHSNVTNNSRYTAPIDGYYELSGCITFAAGTGFRATRWARNATVIPGSQVDGTAAAGAEWPVMARTVKVFLTAGDYVQIQVYQDSGGGALNTGVGSDTQSTMTVTYLRA